MNKKFHIKKGDMVKVIAGDSKGQEGKVLEVLVSKDRAIIEGVNMMKKHTKPSSKHTEGGIIEQEAPIHISNLMLIDPATKKATRIGRKLNDKNKLVRYSKKSGEEIK
jgi:large subunit ribosomal protein L24